MPSTFSGRAEFCLRCPAGCRSHAGDGGGHNQYAPMTGLPALKERIAGKIAALYGTRYDVDHEVLITASASRRIYSAIGGLVHPGDEVIYFEPSFDSYAPIVRLQGRRRWLSS